MRHFLPTSYRLPTVDSPTTYYRPYVVGRVVGSGAPHCLPRSWQWPRRLLAAGALLGVLGDAGPGRCNTFETASGEVAR